MKRFWADNKITICFFAVLLMVMVIICSSVGVVFAEESETSKLYITHITDLHYYPTYMSYKQSELDYEQSAFFANGNEETKLVVESSAALKNLFNRIYQNAPDYLVVTGDLSSDGERQGLIDVANSLRKLQNAIRMNGKPNFQVFVTPGNHDIQNPKAMDYSTLEGELTASVTKAEFASIFAGLGYPNMTEAEANDFYTAEELNRGENKKYLPYIGEELSEGEKTYIHSENAQNITFKYLFQDLRTDDFQTDNLTYLAEVENDLFASVDSVIGGGEVGGKVDDFVLNWLNENIVTEYTSIFSFMHHNVLPHYTYEEQWMGDFLLDNWEDTRNFLSSKGVKCNFSGHMHANDMERYADYDGSVFYDVETGSPISYGAAFREVRVERYASGEQNIYSTLRSLGKFVQGGEVKDKGVDVSTLIEDGFLTEEYNSDLSLWKKNENKISDFSNYIYKKRYQTMLDDMLEGVVHSINKEKITQTIIDTIASKVADNSIANGIFTNIKAALEKAVNNLYDEIQAINLKDYNYDGSITSLQGDENKLRAYVYDFLKNIVNINAVQYGGREYTLQNLFVKAYTTHLQGGEGEVISSAEEWLIAATERLVNGELIEDIIELARNSQKGIIGIIKSVLATSYDLTQGLGVSEVSGLNNTLSLFGTSVNSFNLDKVLQKVLGAEQLPSQQIDKYLQTFLTDSVVQGIGGKLSDLVISFVTDKSYDGLLNIECLFLYDSKNKFSHSKDGFLANASYEEWRRPKMVTSTFGDDISTTRNFVWFTSKYHKHPSILLAECKREEYYSEQTEKKLIYAKQEIYAVDFPLMDIGVFSTYKTKEISRNSIKLTGLKPNTTYCYQLGSTYGGFYTNVYTFTTHSGEKEQPFEALLISDMQGMTKTSYEKTDKLLQATKRVFSENKYDFILNLGDFVDDGRNFDQWRYALDTSQAVYGNVAQIMVVGNHEDYLFKPSEGYIPSSESVKTGAYTPYELHYENGLAKGKSYYSFNYSGVHFVVLDTNDIVNDNLNFEQVAWLENDLKQYKNQIIVVAMHKGIYSEGPHSRDTEIVNMRGTLGRIFSENGVEIVLQGHDHVYSESFFIGADGKKVNNKGYKKGAPINNNNGGVLYISLGTGGDKFYEYEGNEEIPTKFTKKTLHKPTFGRLVFDGRDIKYFGYEYDLKNDKIFELVTFNDMVIKYILSIAGAVVVVLLIGIAIVLLFVNNKKKIAEYKKNFPEN